jgi:hypothetical protein
MSACTIFRKFHVPIEDKSLIVISKWIAEGKYKEEIDTIRLLISENKLEEAQTKKQQLIAFTPSGVFKDKRLLTHIQTYTGFVHLDFDKLTSVQLNDAFKVISEMPFTFLCFISPSGNGLKVFIEVDTGMEHHDIAYSQVQKYYEDATSLKADPSCKDITRLCFMSYDPGLYKNISYEKFKIQLPENHNKPEVHKSSGPVKALAQPSPDTDLNSAFLFNQQIQFTNLKTEYKNGNRNNYMYLLAANCNRAGIHEMDTLDLCVQHFDLPEKEIKASVRSAYNHHSGDFAKFAKSANLQSLNTTSPKHDSHQTGKQSEDEDPLEDFLKNTPTIPDDVYEALPQILKEGSKAFTDRRKRDVFFTGAIAIISGCLPKVTGIYFQERVHPHLFTFIIAPPASGKGVLKNAKRLADKYHQQVLDTSKDDQKKHNIEMVEYKEQMRNRKKGEPAPDQPNKPPFKIVFIPADSSHSRMIEHLQNNDGQGIICETEADTMSGAKKQDWGDYSPTLRSAFHHEKITLTRKTNDEYIEINEPRLAVTLSGTPAQAPKLIASAEDGLFSRFLFYAFKNEIVWQDPSPHSHSIVYNDHFDALSQTVMDLIGF